MGAKGSASWTASRARRGCEPPPPYARVPPGSATPSEPLAFPRKDAVHLICTAYLTVIPSQTYLGTSWPTHTPLETGQALGDRFRAMAVAAATRCVRAAAACAHGVRVRHASIGFSCSAPVRLLTRGLQASCRLAPFVRRGCTACAEQCSPCNRRRHHRRAPGARGARPALRGGSGRRRRVGARADGGAEAGGARPPGPGDELARKWCMR